MFFSTTQRLQNLSRFGQSNGEGTFGDFPLFPEPTIASYTRDLSHVVFARSRRSQANYVPPWMQVFLGEVQTEAGHVFHDEDGDPRVLQQQGRHLTRNERSHQYRVRKFPHAFESK